MKVGGQLSGFFLGGVVAVVLFVAAFFSFTLLLLDYC